MPLTHNNRGLTYTLDLSHIDDIVHIDCESVTQSVNIDGIYLFFTFLVYSGWKHLQDKKYITIFRFKMKY